MFQVITIESFTIKLQSLYNVIETLIRIQKRDSSSKAEIKHHFTSTTYLRTNTPNDSRDSNRGKILGDEDLYDY